MFWKKKREGDPMYGEDQFGSLGRLLGGSAQRTRTWQVIAMVNGAVALVLALAQVQIEASTIERPYIVALDQLGRSYYVGAPQKLEDNDLAVASELSRFVRDIRTVSSDPETMKDLQARAVKFLGTRAHRYVAAQFQDATQNPRALGRMLTRGVRMNSAVRKPGTNEWHLTWTETETELASGSTRWRGWEAFLTVAQLEDLTAEDAQDNHLALQITDLGWTAITTGGKR